MKKIFIFGVTLILINSCEDIFESCECEYVVYDSDPTNNYTWTETYRSTWDDNEDCDDRTIDESTYTASNGDKYYSRTRIECD